MIDTTRNYPRGLRDAFPGDYRESALGIAEPIPVGPRPLLWRIWKFLCQRSPWRT